MTAPAGVGIGWRPEIAGFVDALPGLGFVEVVAEGIGASAPETLLPLMSRGVPIVSHGTRLSLGGAERLDPQRITQFATAAATLGAPMVSEHIAFVRAAGVEAGHLLPVPRTREAVDAIVRNVAQLRPELDVPLALEPIAAVFDWPDAELTEGQFLTEILERTGCLLLLDVANVYANALNRRLDPSALFEALPLDRIAYVHMAGGAEGPGADGVYHDTHTDPIPPAVLDLLSELVARQPVPAVMLERDGHYPPAAELGRELDAIADRSHHPRVTLAPAALPRIHSAPAALPRIHSGPAHTFRPGNG
ncbi:hypothetical protein SAMN04515671_0397 [Nakamurella panacisegetis]|uniref:Uncharacterized protein n=1 Tax=Nakamurella panacisegetis TaxID=1090615 RepID=A0A1H0I8H3_9ACTN|nr:DUF692 domain-containing protein [Nakamurella panacisegetis]SDO27401.1 hypothetical protein SAMN04515671_0397 [Nakamurella panacisegetis]